MVTAPRRWGPPEGSSDMRRFLGKTSQTMDVYIMMIIRIGRIREIEMLMMKTILFVVLW